MVPEIPKYYIFIIKNFLVVVTLMAYGRVSTVVTLCVRRSFHFTTLPLLL